MNRLSIDKRCQIIQLLVEGCSMRSAARISGASITTVMKLLVDVGEACYQFQNKTLINLPCTHIQADEIWAFCYCKKKNVPKDKIGFIGYGDTWTWIAIDPISKLVVSWALGARDAEMANIFIADLASRLKYRIQLSTDAFHVYQNIIHSNFGINGIDYSQLEKIYGVKKHALRQQYLGSKKIIISGIPNIKNTSTSHIERQNLTLRMSSRRFTRKTNAYSKKIENMRAALALHFTHYNFCRIHHSLRISPAMQLNVSNRLWNIQDLINLNSN